MDENPQNDICQRVAQVRLETAGPRGKSRFASELGIPASTYDYYEADRTPPAEVLVKIAEVAGVDLRWLLTGEAGSSVPADHPVLQRAATLLDRQADAARPLAAFLDILEGTLAFAAKSEPIAATQPQADTPADEPAEPAASSVVGQPPDEADRWIPILGRSAAGVPAFWQDPTDASDLTTLGELVARHAADAQTVPANATGEAASDEIVRIVALRESPREPDGPVEFLDAPGIRSRFADAFAVRIDGESMTPEIRHGDLVVLSPSAPALAGRAAVVQLAGAIGVTCKLYHPEGGRVHLVPINETVPPTTVEAGQVDWAFRVLARVRP